MKTQNPTIAVVGAGAVGGFYGARLARAGHDVHFLLRGDYAAVRANGWAVQSPDGDFVLPPESVHAYDDPARMPKPNLVLVALKATHNHLFGPVIAPLLKGGKEGAAILTLQNGLGNEEQLAALFGAERVLGGVAFVCINRAAPGVIHHIDHGAVRLGELARVPSPRAEAVAGVFRSAGIDCRSVDDLRRVRWEKLGWNIPFSGLGAVLDRTADRLIATEQGRRLVSAIIAEVMAAGRADGVTFAVSTEQMIKRQLGITATMGAYRSSMQIDRQQGRPMEVEAILGEPLRRAEAGGAQTPLLRALYEMAKLVDPGEGSG